MITTNSIIIVEDNTDIREMVAAILRDEGYSVYEAAQVDEAIKLAESAHPKVALLDIWLGGDQSAGISLLKHFKKHDPLMPLIMISGHASTSVAADVMKFGAYDFIEKPFKTDKLLLTIAQAFQKRSIEEKKCYLEQVAHKSFSLQNLLGESKFIRKFPENFSPIAQSDRRVIIYGELGVGKALISRCLHHISLRSAEKYIAVNLYGKNSLQVEHELFELYESSMDKNTLNNRYGALEIANRGTLFIDGIELMAPSTQKRLLDVLQNSAIFNGYKQKIPLDLRIIVATSKNLQEMSRTGAFNPTLLARLDGFTMNVPPLRERKEDIPVLMRHFIASLRQEFLPSNYVFAEELLSILQNYTWPGNVKELEHTLRDLALDAYLQRRTYITVELLPPRIWQKAAGGEMVLVNTPVSIGMGAENQRDKAQIARAYNAGGDCTGSAIEAKATALDFHIDNYKNTEKFPQKQDVRLLLHKKYREAQRLFQKEYICTQLVKFNNNISKTAEYMEVDRTALHRKIKELGIRMS